MKNIKNLAICILLSLPLYTMASNDTTEFKNKIDFLLKKNLDKKDILLVDNPETYIWNLKTTDFLKGLLFETTMVLDFMAKNSENKNLLREFSKEFEQNSTCISIIIGNSGNHFNTIYNLTLKEPSEKEAYFKAYDFLSNQIKPYQLSKEYIDLCQSERLKVIEYSKKNR